MGVFKKTPGRPSNETIKKRNIFKGMCVLLIFIIIILVSFIISDKQINKDNTLKPNSNDANININDDLVKDLYNKVKDTFIYNYNFVHNDEEKYTSETLYDNNSMVLAKDLTNDFKGSMVITYIVNKKNDSHYYNSYISYDEFMKNYEKIFGKRCDFESFYSYSLYRGYVTLDKNNTYILLDDNETFKSLGVDIEMGIGYTLVDVKKDNDNIYLYEASWINDSDYYMGSDTSNVKFKYYKESVCYFDETNNIVSKIKTYDCNCIFESKNSKDDKNIILHKDEFDQYKFTFTMNKKGEYIFKSVEKVK